MEKKIVGKDTLDGYSYSGHTPNFAQGAVPSFNEPNAEAAKTHKTRYIITGTLIGLGVILFSVILYLSTR